MFLVAGEGIYYLELMVWGTGGSSVVPKPDSRAPPLLCCILVLSQKLVLYACGLLFENITLMQVSQTVDA